MIENSRSRAHRDPACHLQERADLPERIWVENAWYVVGLLGAACPDLELRFINYGHPEVDMASVLAGAFAAGRWKMNLEMWQSLDMYIESLRE